MTPPTQAISVPPNIVPTGGAQELLSQAVQKGANIETLERLMALRKDMLAEEAKRAFNDAMAAFQEECPIIEKKTNVDNKYKYAKIDSIVSQVKPFIKKHGFRYATTMAMDDVGVTVTVRVVHSMGHEELSVMQVPFGSGTSLMSKPQVVAAATTFAKRYAFLNAFGIMTGDEDVDGATDKLDAPKGEQKRPQNAPKQRQATPPPAQGFPATNAQKNCITRHWHELAQHEQAKVTEWMQRNGIRSETMTKRQASAVIDEMQRVKGTRNAGAAPRGANSPAAAPASSAEDIEAFAHEMESQPDLFHLNQVWFRIKPLALQPQQRKYLEDVRAGCISKLNNPLP